VNLATYVSLAVCLAGGMFAAMTWAIASAPNMRGLRFFSLACTWGALYALSNATLATGSFELSRWGIRSGMFFTGLHGATWFVYTARREARSLFTYERLIVAGCIAWACLSLVPNLLYHSDEQWIHGVPALGIRYVDARSTIVGDVAFGFMGFAMASLLWRPLIRIRTATRTERAEAVGLVALALCGLNDSLVTADVINAPYLLDVGFLALVVAVGSALARRFVDNANQLATAQAELIQGERLAALGEMSAVVAHEVRNPVAVIFNAAASMRRSPDQRDQLLSIVEEEAGRLKQMVTDLLDFARPASVRLVDESLAPIIQSALDAVRQANPNAPADIEVSLDEDVPLLRCDVQMLRQAIVNLVSNAIQSPDRKGPVRITVGMTSDGRILLTVIDDGAGVAADIADQIFRPFFTTRPTGTGLGLAVVQRIVRAHGGELVHRATPGGGATFELRLPLRPGA
jgi:signal transduction histidine kinase